ncbi:MAG: ABC transporter permease [Dysgonamonadaceae bacterium]|jgi:ABC-2 type transport system permease protein|nr:ABC transporter permease [Dysgonamonadaceae bacterium]
MQLRKIIKKGFADLFIIWSREIKYVYKDIGVVIFFIVVPLIYPIIYGFIYNPETIREVSLVVVEESHSSIAREFIRKINASPDVNVYVYAANMDEAKKIVDRKEAYGILQIPSEFSRKLHRGEQSEVILYLDMSGLLFYKAILLATTEASLQMGKEINVNAEDMPIQYEAISMYNTQNGFASFLVPGILMLVIQQTLLLGVGMLAATSREKNRGKLIPPGSTHEGASRIVFGKALAYFTIYIFVCIWALAVVPRIFNLIQIARPGNLLLFALPYLSACIFLTMAISTFVRGRETPMMIFVFTSLPLLFLSGISWPASAIPDFWRYFSYLFPSTFGIQGFVKLNSMGATLHNVAWEYRMLWLQAGIYFLVTSAIYMYNVHRDKGR